MKTFYFILIFCAALLAHNCGEAPVDSRYYLVLPELPDSWETVLGSPHWQLEWISDSGNKETRIVQGDARSLEVTLPQTWASPVVAMPFWPEKSINTGLFKPAGAIFPHDVSGKTLVLSWQGGVDASLFWEFAAAYGRTGQVSATPRLPHNFNWPRFRALFDDPALNGEVRADPWLADWSSIAERTVQSGFDRRRLVPEARSSISVPVTSGPWVGTSPFAAPLFFEGIPVFPVRQTADTWVSFEGIIRCSSETWIFFQNNVQ
ncbi:MAG: hypothetical protein FWG89_01565 [Treponema sp.]|nr:hypothetical protein [Treponema sp.]